MRYKTITTDLEHVLLQDEVLPPNVQHVRLSYFVRKVVTFINICMAWTAKEQCERI